MIVMHPAHLRSIVFIPPVEFLQRNVVRLLETFRERFNQLVFNGSSARRKRTRFLDIFVCNAGAYAGLTLALFAPEQIVEGALTVGDSPIHHRALRIELFRFLETFHASFEIESETPVQAKIEPPLRLW